MVISFRQINTKLTHANIRLTRGRHRRKDTKFENLLISRVNLVFFTASQLLTYIRHFETLIKGLLKKQIPLDFIPF